MGRTEGKPHDRLTGLANEVLDELWKREGTEDVKAIVMLTDEEWNGIGLGGWEDDHEALAHMLVFMQGILEANGQRMEVITL